MFPLDILGIFRASSAVVLKPVGHDPSGGCFLIYPAYQIFTLQFMAVAKYSYEVANKSCYGCGIRKAENYCSSGLLMILDTPWIVAASVSLCFFFFFFYHIVVSQLLCNPGWSRAFRVPPASVPRVLGLKVCLTTPSFFSYKDCHLPHTTMILTHQMAPQQPCFQIGLNSPVLGVRTSTGLGRLVPNSLGSFLWL